ncbi:hypothetical protein [Phormidesmis priestleyi]|uniref:hypothetical protein n=1 Tax=Phormidesmis priestleyi TaxID=268141 RepID=UPI00116011DF|nr:hypothetical protein [Phormidesmis priestleyi]
MAILLILIAAFYLFVVAFLADFWLAFFKRDSQLSRSEKRSGLVIITIAAMLWIFVIPFAYLELLAKRKKLKRDREITSYFSDPRSGFFK